MKSVWTGADPGPHALSWSNDSGLLQNAGVRRPGSQPRALEVEREVKPLDGIRVLDFTHALAGPLCTLLLADYGAEIFKLEPRCGDMGRGWGPPFAGGDAHFFLGLNRGKQGISLDLKTPEGRDLCVRLAARVDVLIENFRPGAMDRLGLGYQTLRERNPRLIYCSISGYGQSGPARDEAAMDLVVQASSGLLSITGAEDGEYARCGYGVTDATSGLLSAIGILLALRARDLTGSGQYVDVAMLDSMIFTMSSNFMSYLGSGHVPGPMGTAFPTVVPYRVFRTADTAIAIAVGSEKLWSAFCAALDRPDLETHPDYATNGARIRHRAALEPLLACEFQKRPTSEWIALLQGAGIPASPVRNLEEVVEHPQSAIREMFPALDHPAAGRHRVTGTPVKLSATPGAPGAPAPLLGQHTFSVLKDLLDLDYTAIEALFAAGAIYQPPPDEPQP